MFDADAAVFQRSHGEAQVSLHAGPAAVKLGQLYQRGSAKAILAHPLTLTPEVVFLNTSGGLTGGDTLAYKLALGDGVRATGTTQTAERVYASAGDAAIVDVDLQVGRDGWLDWLPQETIIFDAAQMRRHSKVNLAATAGCLLSETIVLGRVAMGEILQNIDIVDKRQVTRAGKPVFIEPLHLTRQTLGRSDGSAVLGGARAFCTIALIAQGAEDRAATLRAELACDDVTGAVSGFDGKCVVRLLARDALPLRRQVLRLLSVLKPGGMPRVWQC